MRKLLSIAAMSLTATAAIASGPAPAEMATMPDGPRSLLELKGFDVKPHVNVPMKAPARVTAADFTDRSFGAALIWSENWKDMSITEVPYGLYDFTIGTDGVTSSAKWSNMSENWMSGAVRRNRFYGIRNNNMFGALTGVATTVIDMNDWSQVSMTFADEPSFALLPSTMSYDWVTGDIYGVFYNADLTGQNWVRYNTLTLEPEIICPFNGRFNVLAMGTAADGKIYIVSSEGDLYTVNRANSRVSLVGNTGVNTAAYTQAMGWDSKTNTFLWLAVTPTGSALYSLDPTVPSTKLVKRLTDGAQIASLYFLSQEKMDGAPAAPETPVWNFTSQGAFDGNITMKVPDAGSITVYLDGETVKEEESVSAGTTVTIPFSGLSNATHHVSAVVKNSKGYSPVAESFQYAGHDVPLPVTDVTFTEADGTATVAWTAPAGGVEDGFIDPSRLYYKIYRLPDNIEVASHHTSTTFTETLPQTVRRYAYRVVAYNGDDKVSAPATSNALIYGESYNVPFTEDFLMDDPLETYTIINATEGSRGWNLNTNGSVPLLSSGEPGNWILSPKIKLEANTLYRLTIHMRNMWAGTPDHITVGYAKGGASRIDEITTVKDIEVNTPSMTLLDHTADFTVPAAGEYEFAIGYITETKNSGVFIDRLQFDAVGNVKAPAAVTEFTVTPDADRAPKATLALTAPVKAIDGSALSGSLSATFYRDGAEIGTKDAIATGSQVSWTDDTNPAAGDHTYTVKMKNSYGLGADASATAFVGIYTPPFEDALDTRESINKYTFKVQGFEDDALNSGMHFPSWGDPCLEVDHNNQTAENHEMWVVFPWMEFENETVYKISFERKQVTWGDGLSYEIVYGDSPEPEALTSKAFDVPNPEGWDYDPFEGLMILTNDGGRKYVALHITAPTNGYLYYYMRNLKIERQGSSLAPDVVTDLVATSDLTSKLTMKAPATDYAGRPLAELDKIEVYRNGSTLPVYTFESPEPGASLEWIDENAILGTNSYFIVPSNSHGRGNAVLVKSFIGFDEPVMPAGIAITPSADNQTATITWQRPKRGVNGGVLNEDEMTFTLVKFHPEAAPEEQIEVLKEGITETTVVPERVATDNQELIYYGIATVTPQGTSTPSVYFTILGKPYSYPFAENFVNGEAASSMWLNTGTNALQAMPTNEEVLAYNGFSGVSQDGDKGVFMFLNGAMSEYPVPFAVLSPKVSLAGASKPTLSLWLYKGNQSGSYQTVPSLNISAATDEATFVELGDEKWDAVTAPTWVECVYSLDRFVGDPGALIIQFVATSGGMSDIMLMDNVRIDEEASIDALRAGGDDCNAIAVKGGILTRGAVGSQVNVYTPAGMLVDSFAGDDTVRSYGPGLYLVSFKGRTFKVVVI